MAEFKENRAGIEEMLRAPFMVAEMQRRVDKGKAHAEGIAPVRTGHYKSVFTATAGVRDGRAYGRLANSARSHDGFLYALALEVGTRYMKAQKILKRSIDAMSGRG